MERDDDDLNLPEVPRMTLHEAVGSLVQVARQVTATQERLRALIRANQAVTEHLDLATVLHKIVETAMKLVQARQGALDTRAGVDTRSAGARAAQVVSVGMSEHEVATLVRLAGSDTPAAGGTRREGGRTLTSVADAGDDAEDPGLAGLLRVPIRVAGEPYGTLYLVRGHGERFSAEDEQVVAALATTAGFAIDNARLFADSQRRQAWATASAEITAALVSNTEEEDFLAVLTARTLSLADADLVSVVRLTDDVERLVIETARRRDGTMLSGTVFPAAGSVAASVVEGGHPRLLDEAEVEETADTPGRETGPTMAVPLSSAGEAQGALVVSRVTGREPFSSADLQMAADFAGRIGVAMRLARARTAEERLALLEERGRIARDLHDHVIQQLFATGLSLQSVLGALPAGTVLDRVAHSIDTLDATISRIRTAIFALARTRDDAAATRHRIIDLADELNDALPEPQIEFSGPVDLAITETVADDVVAVTREALTNVAKHAAAKHVSVRVQVEGGEVTVTVTDDGVGVPAKARRSGLDNLAQRAAGRSGAFAIESREGGGTRLVWSARLDASARSDAAGSAEGDGRPAERVLEAGGVHQAEREVKA